MYHLSSLAWLQPGWLEEVGRWSSACLKLKGITVRGPGEQFHIRPWSTVVRFPTNQGDVYFKAAAPALAHEAGLTRALAQMRPDCMPTVLDVDLGRGWILMGDMGIQLRSQMASRSDAGRWTQILALYAGLQIEMIDRQSELLALGAMDRRLSCLPELFDQVLKDTSLLVIDLPDGLTSQEHVQLCKMVPYFTEMCERLSRCGIPETLHHDDFHDGNIFIRGGQIIFSDWGESCVAHPFFTMVVNLRSNAYRLGLAEDAPEILQIQADYLKEWSQFGSQEQLLEAYRLSSQIGMVCRALTWHRVLAGIDPDDRKEHEDAVSGWLKEFLLAVQAQ
jgi:hypothetical protein